jgi:hypothetical protein
MRQFSQILGPNQGVSDSMTVSNLFKYDIVCNRVNHALVTTQSLTTHMMPSSSELEVPV